MCPTTQQQLRRELVKRRERHVLGVMWRIRYRYSCHGGRRLLYGLRVWRGLRAEGFDSAPLAYAQRLRSREIRENKCFWGRRGGVAAWRVHQFLSTVQ